MMSVTGCMDAGCALVNAVGGVGGKVTNRNEIGGTTLPDLAPAQLTGKGVPSSLAQPAPNSGAAGQLAAPAFSEGKRARHSGYRHDWSPEHDALVHLMIEGVISTGEAARRVGVSAVSIRYRARRLGLVKAPLPALKGHEELPERLTPAHGWVPIAHKADRKWRLYDGAPVTIIEAQDMVQAGIATTAQRRVDGGFDLLVRMR